LLAAIGFGRLFRRLPMNIMQVLIDCAPVESTKIEDWSRCGDIQGRYDMAVGSDLSRHVES
jgi:hypothetical protein